MFCSLRKGLVTSSGIRLWLCGAAGVYERTALQAQSQTPLVVRNLACLQFHSRGLLPPASLPASQDVGTVFGFLGTASERSSRL